MARPSKLRSFSHIIRELPNGDVLRLAYGEGVGRTKKEAEAMMEKEIASHLTKPDAPTPKATRGRKK